MATASSSRRPAATRSSRSPESFDSLRKRDAAAEILQSYEKLSWVSFHRCETIMQTRLHFQRIVAGFDSDMEGKDIRWKEDFTRHPKSAENDARSSRKGKERASLGGEGGRDAHGSKSKEKASLTLNADNAGEQPVKDDEYDEV